MNGYLDTRIDVIAFHTYDPPTDGERFYYALAEVGLEPEESGGGWFGWHRHLSDDEWRLVDKADELAQGKDRNASTQTTQKEGPTRGAEATAVDRDV